MTSPNKVYSIHIYYFFSLPIFSLPKQVHQQACQGLLRDASRIAPCVAICSAWTRACASYRWSVRIAADLVVDTQTPEAPLDVPIDHSVGDVAAKPTKPKAIRHHEVWRNAEFGWCRLCGAQAAWTSSSSLRPSHDHAEAPWGQGVGSQAERTRYLPPSAPSTTGPSQSQH